MKFALLLVLMWCASVAQAQTFPIDTLRMSGDPAHRINVVILGDGYTSTEQSAFRDDANNLATYLLSQSPWSNYSNYFNVFAIEVPSTESGTAHPNNAPDCGGTGVPVITADTYFGCSFDAFGIHRLVVPAKASAIASVLAANFPNYDQVLVVAHSPYYGGSGGAYATATVNTSSNEIVAHEIGHSFAGLADEYWAGPQYAAEKPNMTRESVPALIRWTHWLTAGSGVGIYPHTGDPSWYKPSQSCKMEALGNPYCAVCSEAIVERIHSLIEPYSSYSPRATVIDVTAPSVQFALDSVIAPKPNTLRTTWSMDGAALPGTGATFTLDPASIAVGTHTLTSTTLDTTPLVRTDNHFTTHVYSVDWTINKTQAIVINATAAHISMSLYPDPARDHIRVSIETEMPEEIGLQIVATDGTVVRTLEPTAPTSLYSESLSISDLPVGAYTILAHVGQSITRLGFVKN